VLVKDVDRPRLHDKEGGLALALLEKSLSGSEQPMIGGHSQLRDLGLGQPREQGGFVRIEEIIHPRSRCSRAYASALPGALAVLAGNVLGHRDLHPACRLSGRSA